MKIWRPAEGCSSCLPLSISSASWSSVFSLTTLLVCSDKLVTTAYVWHNSNDSIKIQGKMLFFAKPLYLPLPPFIFCSHTWGTPLMRNHWRRKLRTFGYINFKIPSNLLILHRVVVLPCFLLDRDVNVISGIVVFTFRILNVGWCITFKSLQTSSLRWLSFSRDLKMWEVFSYSDKWRNKLTTTNKLTLVVYLWNVTRSTLLSLL